MVAGYCGELRRSWIKGRPRTSWTKSSVLYLNQLQYRERLLTVCFDFLRETTGDLDLTSPDQEEKLYDLTLDFSRFSMFATVCLRQLWFLQGDRGDPGRRGSRGSRGECGAKGEPGDKGTPGEPVRVISLLQIQTCGFNWRNAHYRFEE